MKPVASVEEAVASGHIFLPAQDYDLARTLSSGQAFRWRRHHDAWEGVIGSHWVRLRQQPGGISAETALPVADWSWLEEYLQTGVNLQAILSSFPDDAPLRAARAACHGLRLLRQEPWECLASFILSSTKQIVQIEQIVAALCERFGAPVAVPAGHEPAFAFPRPERLASASEAELRACKMGFRAPKLLATARLVAEGQVDLAGLRSMTLDQARATLLRLPGVGPKIAECVLLFAYGFAQAFPVDVWVNKALRQLYFPRRGGTSSPSPKLLDRSSPAIAGVRAKTGTRRARPSDPHSGGTSSTNPTPSPKRLRDFIRAYFGPQAGYAQQYLFCYMRAHGRDGVRAVQGGRRGRRPPPQFPVCP